MRTRVTLHLAAIALIILISYANSLDSSFHLDDISNIADNKLITDFSYFSTPDSAAWHQQYPFFMRRTVGFFSLYLNYLYGGLETRGYHAVNTAILAVCAIGLLLLVRMAFEGRHDKVALLCAAIFATHPVNTQAITYIVQRFASLAAMFYVLALCFYLWARTSHSRHWLYALSLIAALLAFRTKEHTVTLPAMVFLLEAVVLRSGLRRAAASGALALIVALMVPYMVIKYPSDAAGAFRLHTEFGRGDYMLAQLSVAATYLRLFFLPIGQNLDYDYPLQSAMTVPAAALHIALISGAVFLAGTPSRREPLLRGIAFGVLWFYITLLPESSIVPIRDVIFEHRAFLPYMGLALAFSCAITLALRHMRGATSAFMCILLVLMLSVLTIHRNQVWQTEMSLWQDVVQKSPLKARPWNNLGWAYESAGLEDKAAQFYGKALALDPQYADAHLNLGYYHAKRGAISKAVEHFRAALAAEPRNLKALLNLGAAELDLARPEQATATLMKALVIDRSNAQAHYLLGRAYARMGLKAEAVSSLNQSLRLRPGFAPAQAELRAIQSSP